MFTKKEFNSMAIKTCRKNLGAIVLNRAFKKKNKKQFITDYIKSLNTEKMEDDIQEEYRMNLMIRDYEEEFDTDANMIMSVGSYYSNILISSKIPEGFFRVHTGFFVKMYTTTIKYWSHMYPRWETVLVVVPNALTF